MNNPMEGIDDYLELIHDLESKIIGFILKTDLTEEEKKFILEHILIVPGSKDQ